MEVRKYLLIVLSVLCAIVIGDRKDFAANLLRCARINDLDQCLRFTLEDLRALMPVGFPEFGLGPSEPLKIHNLKFESRPAFAGTVSIDAKFTNVSTN